MKKNIVLSVIMLTYNHEEYIDLSLSSALNQKTDFDYEIIIGDDCSQDNTIEKITKYQMKNPDKIKLIAQKRNLGVVKNLLETLKFSKGKYIAILDGDDYWNSSSKLQKSVDFLEKNEDYIATYNNVLCVDQYNNPRKDFFQKNLGDLKQIQDQLDYNPIVTCSLVFKNIWGESFIDVYSCYLKNIKYICDLSLKILLIENGKVKHFKEYLSTYRLVNSGTSAFSAQKQLIQIEDEIQAYLNILDNISSNNFYLVKKRLQQTMYQGIKKIFISKDIISLSKLLKINYKTGHFKTIPFFKHCLRKAVTKIWNEKSQ